MHLIRQSTASLNLVGMSINSIRKNFPGAAARERARSLAVIVDVLMMTVQRQAPRPDDSVTPRRREPTLRADEWAHKFGPVPPGMRAHWQILEPNQAQYYE